MADSAEPTEAEVDSVIEEFGGDLKPEALKLAVPEVMSAAPRVDSVDHRLGNARGARLCHLLRLLSTCCPPKRGLTGTDEGCRAV